MTLQDWRDVFQIIYFVALSVTGPLALFSYLEAKRKERQQQEDGTYHALDEKYMGYQELCLKYPNLDVFDYPLANPQPLNDADRQREAIMFTMLISILERAFIMYRVNSPAVRQRQWDGWVEYIDAFMRRENFRMAWDKYSEMFDTDFRAFVASRIIQPNVEAAKVTSNSP